MASQQSVVRRWLPPIWFARQWRPPTRRPPGGARRRLRPVALAWASLALLLACGAAAADGGRMYQWRHPETGTVQLSGAAPSWYRAQGPGPRVLVYDRGRVIDDTARPVSEAERLALRAEAFGMIEPAAPAAEALPVPAVPPATPAPPEPAAITADDIAHYKAVVEAWDRAQRERAAATVGGGPPPPPWPVPPPPGGPIAPVPDRE